MMPPPIVRDGIARRSKPRHNIRPKPPVAQVAVDDWFVGQMPELDSIRRHYAKQIRDVVWRRYRLRVSDELCSAFARIRREDFLGAAPWLIRGTATQSVWQQVVSRFSRRLRRYDYTTDDATRLYHSDTVVAIDASRGLNNGQPSGLAAWLQVLDLRQGDRVLHIRCGLGTTRRSSRPSSRRTVR